MALPPVERQVENALNSIHAALKVIIERTVDEDTYQEVATLEGELWDVRNRVSFILMRIRDKQENAQ